MSMNRETKFAVKRDALGLRDNTIVIFAGDKSPMHSSRSGLVTICRLIRSGLRCA